MSQNYAHKKVKIAENQSATLLFITIEDNLMLATHS